MFARHDLRGLRILGAALLLAGLLAGRGVLALHPYAHDALAAHDECEQCMAVAASTDPVLVDSIDWRSPSPGQVLDPPRSRGHHALHRCAARPRGPPPRLHPV